MSKLIQGVNDLQTKYPEAAKYWHPTLNEPLTPSDVAYGSKIEVVWICEKGHVWSKKVNSFTSNLRRNPKSSGCPVCDNKVVLAGYNDLATKFPEIAKQWDWGKNKNMGKTPTSITPYTNSKFFWEGDCGHSWEARVADRTLKNAGCPECANNRMHSGINDLQTLAPMLCSQWNEEKNGLPADKVAANSHTQYWWKCELGHEWQDSPNRRFQQYRKTGFVNCPVCTKALHTSFPEKAVFFYASNIFKSVSENYSFEGRLELDVFIEDEKIAIEYDGGAFHGEKKGKSDAKKNRACKNKGIKLFRLREDSCFTLDDDGQITIPMKTNPGFSELDTGLRNLFSEIGKYLNRELDIDINIARDEEKIYALQRLYLRKNSLYEMRPDLLKEWDYEQNDKMGITPKGILASSNICVYWKCKFGHPSWKASPNARAKSGCPYCTGKKVLVGVNDLATVFSGLMEEWDTELNTIDPHNVAAQSDKEAYWVCRNNPNHRWSSQITNRTTKGAGCPFCSSNQLLIGDNDFKTRYPEVAKEWDYEKNDTRPEEYFPSSTKVVWWKGGKCGHSWDMRIVDRTGKKPQGCPICAGKRVLIGFNDFPSQNPEVFKEWDWERNKEDPYSLTVSSNKKVNWICVKNPKHTWKVSIDTRRRTGCPYCSGNKVLPGDNDLKTLYPEIAEEWDYEGNAPLLPENVSPHSGILVLWKGKCGHTWPQKVGARTGKKKQGCPYCSGRKPIVGENDLQTLYPEVAKQWYQEKNGELKPSDVGPGSHIKVFWLNEDGTESYEEIRGRIRKFCNKNNL